MDSPDDPVTAALAVGTAIVGGGSQLYASKRTRDQSSDADRRAKRNQAELAGQAKENKLQGQLGDSISADRRRERARQLLSSGRMGTIKTTPLGVMGDASMGAPKYAIGA